MTPRIQVDELGGRRHLVAQVRQLEVRVRVDQAGQERDLAEIDDVARRRPDAAPGRAERDDAAAVDRDPAVADRRLGDRQHPGGVIADHRKMARQDG